MKSSRIKREKFGIAGDYYTLYKNLTEITLKINMAVKSYFCAKERNILNKSRKDIIKYRKKFIFIYKRLNDILKMNGYSEEKMKNFNKRIKIFIRYVDLLLAAGKSEEETSSIIVSPKILDDFYSYSNGVIVTAAIMSLSA